MIQAIKIKLYPSDNQKTYMNKLLGTSRFIYNQCLTYKIIEYQLWNTNTNLSDTYKHVKKLKTKFNWIKESHSKVLQQSLINLETAYKNFFKDKKGFPKYKSKHNKQSCRFPVDAISGIKGNRINIIKTLKDIHFKCSRKDEILLNKYQSIIKSGTLSKDKTNDYYFSVLIDLPLKSLKKSTNMVGIDLGIKNFVISSCGAIYENLNFKKKQRSKLKKLHRSFSRKQNKSNNKEKARLKFAKLNNKIDHQKEYYLHYVVNQLLRDNQTIVMEDLNVKGMMKNHNLARAIQSVSWNRFKQILTYKAEWYDRKIIVINRWFPSSKLCHKCGHKKEDLKLSDRMWTCQSCGTQLDRDHNASLNIKNEGKRIIGMSLPELTPLKSKSLDPRRIRKQTIKMMKMV